MKKLQIIGIILILCSGCQKKEIVTFYNNNNPRVINYYSRFDSTDFIQKGFYRVGELKYVSKYENGKQHGNYKEYYKSGQIKLDKEFVKGIAHGKEIGYHENGAKSTECEIKNGKIENGESISWYDNGQIEVKYTLINEKAEGEWLRYYKNGILMEKGVYKNDTLIGEFSTYDDTGKLIEIQLYENGEIVN